MDEREHWLDKSINRLSKTTFGRIVDIENRAPKWVNCGSTSGSAALNGTWTQHRPGAGTGSANRAVWRTMETVRADQWTQVAGRGQRMSRTGSASLRCCWISVFWFWWRRCVWWCTGGGAGGSAPTRARATRPLGFPRWGDGTSLWSSCGSTTDSKTRASLWLSTWKFSTWQAARSFTGKVSVEWAEDGGTAVWAVTCPRWWWVILDQHLGANRCG